ncbi:MAG: SUMF1/EgtB/PvdO family nonheme iron enzyme [Rhodobacterales bacterium]|nr:SUMF1/EgtB/PvdO family nonheme iron enzyme [Rhodobacterales bacterium]
MAEGTGRAIAQAASASTASNRVNRGGSWNNNPRNTRVANRNRNTPSNRNNNVGFRLASSARAQTGRMPVGCGLRTALVCNKG